MQEHKQKISQQKSRNIRNKKLIRQKMKHKIRKNRRKNSKINKRKGINKELQGKHTHQPECTVLDYAKDRMVTSKIYGIFCIFFIQANILSAYILY